MSLKTERIKQPVVTGTTQPLKLGGILEDGSDSKLTIATDGSITATTAVTVPSLNVTGGSVTVNGSSVASPTKINNSLLAEYTVTGSAVTSIDFSGLDINTHKSYRIEIDMICGSTTANYYMFINGDVTNSNYYIQYVQSSSTTLSSARSNFADIGAVLTGGVSNTNLILEKIGGYPRATVQHVRDVASSLLSQLIVYSKTATVTNITQLTFTAAVANAIGVGSTIRIYRNDV